MKIPHHDDYPNQMCEWKWQKMIARTCQPKARYWVWKGERKTAKFLMMTFAYRFTYNLFYCLHIRRVDAFLKRGPSNLNNIYHAYIYINVDNKYLDMLDLRNILVSKKTKSQIAKDTGSAKCKSANCQICESSQFAYLRTAYLY
jgi:hypothetical protein